MVERQVEQKALNMTLIPSTTIVVATNARWTVCSIAAGVLQPSISMAASSDYAGDHQAADANTNSSAKRRFNKLIVRLRRPAYLLDINVLARRQD